MVLFESLALLGGLKDVFLYNRDLYMFNRQINQARIYQTQKMRIEQILLFREDLRKLFDLTVGKMENYLVVNTLTLAFCMAFFYEGRMPMDTPSWLFWLWGMSLGTAILFLFMSVWFAIYASITAQTFAVRLLTQWLRLPVPSRSDITKAAATAADFEKQNASALLRLPIVTKETQAGLAASQGSSQSVPSSSSNDLPPTQAAGPMRAGARAAAPVGPEQESYPEMVNPALQTLFAREYQTFVEHFHLFRYLQEHWAGYDAYARVCMVVGSAQLLNVIAYMGIGWYIVDDARWGGAIFTVLMIAFGIVHARMNLLLSRFELIALCTFQVAGPLVGCAAGVMYYMNKHELYGAAISWLTPVAFLFHMLSILFYVSVGSERNGALPTKYSTVVSIDVLGLWDDDRFEDDEEGGALLGWNAPLVATHNALTGWQKRWLKATKREAPVSALIPPSSDMTHAERERHLRPRGSNRNLILNRMMASSTSLGAGGQAEVGLVAEPMLAPTKHVQTHPWVAFRQAGALAVLLWVGAVAVGITVAVNGDIPGWDSDPSVHQGTVGTTLWTPLTLMTGKAAGGSRSDDDWIDPELGSVVSGVTSVVGEGHLTPILARLAQDGFPSAPVQIQAVRGVTSEGVHVVVAPGNGEAFRAVITANEDTNKFALVDYADFPHMKPFRTLIGADHGGAVDGGSGYRIPWCLAMDTVTMVSPGIFLDCSSLGTDWTIANRPGLMHQFTAVTGRYALNAVDHQIYKFQFNRKSSSVRVDSRIWLDSSLRGSVVDLAKNDYLMACITPQGLLGVWTTVHGLVPRKGVRILPTNVRWKHIVGAGGKSFIVFGELIDTGMNEAYFIDNILLLPRQERVHHK